MGDLLPVTYSSLLQTMCGAIIRLSNICDIGMDVSTHSSYLLLSAPLLLLLCWHQVKGCYKFSKFKAKPSLWVALAKR